MPKKEHAYLKSLKSMFLDGRISRREFLRQTTLLGTSAAAAYSLAGTSASVLGVGAAHAQDMPKGGHLRIAMRCYELENPHKFSNTEASNVSRQVYDYLTVTGRDNVTRPSLCERWEASDDLKTWTLHLRQDVNYHNGRRFTADDAIWNLNRVLDPATGSSVLGLMDPFLVETYETGELDDKGNPKKASRLWDANAIEKIDDFTVRLNGKTGQIAVPEYLFHYPLVMMDPEQGGTMEVGAANGTGAFELAEAQVRQRHVLIARKDDYWGGGPHLDTLEFIDFGDESSASMLAFSSQQVDGMYGVDPTMMATFDAMPHAKPYPVLTSGVGLVRVRMNMPPFDDIRVRKALRHATNPKELVEAVLHGAGYPGEHVHAGPMHPDYAELPEFKYDPELAKQLLAEAGHPDGIDIEITVKEVAWERQTVQAMVAQWEKANIRASIKMVPTTLYWEKWLTSELPCGFSTWSHRPLAVMLLGLAYRSGAGWNESVWNHPEFDRLLAQAESTLDITERKKIMLQLETIMQDEGPLVVPFWKENVTYMSERVRGFALHPTHYIFGNELGIEA